jgi:hypothetical protein
VLYSCDYELAVKEWGFLSTRMALLNRLFLLGSHLQFQPPLR